MNFNEFLTSLSIAFALGCDAFAVGMAVGTSNPCARACFRLWFHFGLFQFLMPIIGWATGKTLFIYIKSYGHWLAFAMLFLIATKMLRESLQQEENDELKKTDPTRGWSLAGLSVATSIDALGVGFSMGMSQMNLWTPAVIIGITAAIMTYSGITLGRKMSGAIGKRVETFGAIVLYAISFKFLLF